ncbi:MAG: hypothetical protein AB8F95_14915 [Bacteroidia bacterium]
MYKLTIRFFQLLLIVSLGVISQSCEDACADVACQNGGACLDGVCECADGFEGEFCQNAIPVQKRLDAGTETPLQLTQKGVILDSLYGKTYKGGIIFFVNTEPSKYPNFTGEGMVTTDEDYGNFNEWGCFQVTGATGAEVGDGPANHQKILDAMCSRVPSSTQLVEELTTGGFSDWFLPSIGEVDLMYHNLHLKGHSNFLRNIQRFQSSTEADANNFMLRLFWRDEIAPISKVSGDDIRPARIF